MKLKLSELILWLEEQDGANFSKWKVITEAVNERSSSYYGFTIKPANSPSGARYIVTEEELDRGKS